MKIWNGRQCRRGCAFPVAALAVVAAAALGGCAEQTGPAPVFIRGNAPPIAAPLPPPPPAPRQIIVQRGQTLRGIAHAYHVPPDAIIAANRLQAPYELKRGARLVIPEGISEAPGAIPGAIPGEGAVMPAPMPSAVAAAEPLPAPARPAAIAPEPTRQAAEAPPVSPPASAARVLLPDIIPLDGPPHESAAPPPPAPHAAAPAGAPPAAPPAAGADVASQESTDTVAGRFPWPVRGGRILASYGSPVGGGRNDGINIAAPRGTPVRAIDAGVVAYAGNEVKGYGNLILIKHANGWISAYAHLDQLSLKVGERVAAGDVIGHVSDSGGADQPQLHFELRRGKKPVDPSEFLAPAPSAAAPAPNRAG